MTSCKHSAWLPAQVSLDSMQQREEGLFGCASLQIRCSCFDFGCINGMTGNLLPPHNPRHTHTHTHTHTQWVTCAAGLQAFSLNMCCFFYTQRSLLNYMASKVLDSQLLRPSATQCQRISSDSKSYACVVFEFCFSSWSFPLSPALCAHIHADLIKPISQQRCSACFSAWKYEIRD